MRLVYAIMSCVLLVILVFCGVRIERLEQINSDWSASYQLLQHQYGVKEFAWDDERKQWQEAVEGRDEIIEWYKNQPPKIVTETVVKEVPIEVIKEVIKTEIQQVPIPLKQYDSVEQFLNMYKGSITYLRPNVCLPVAEVIQQSSLNNGYIISVAFAQNHYYYGKYVTKEPNGHAGILLGTTDGVYYFIDPNDWRVTKLW
ncbi:MAG: hypothetical protein PHQ86_04740 [Dehalococcoidales bacterium]|nr:hypothetical protein [Dehalococcoidales bacterium]